MSGEISGHSLKWPPQCVFIHLFFGIILMSLALTLTLVLHSVGVCVCALLTGGMVEQLPVLPIVASLSVLVLLCSAMWRRLLESLQEKKTQENPSCYYESFCNKTQKFTCCFCHMSQISLIDLKFVCWFCSTATRRISKQMCLLLDIALC